MSQYEEEMEMICNAARIKMTLNKHKGAIESLSPNKAFELLLGEANEMMEAYTAEDWDQVIIEAGDCMNFVVSIICNAKSRYRNKNAK